MIIIFQANACPCTAKRGVAGKIVAITSAANGIAATFRCSAEPGISSLGIAQNRNFRLGEARQVTAMRSSANYVRPTARGNNLGRCPARRCMAMLGRAQRCPAITPARAVSGAIFWPVMALRGCAKQSVAKPSAAQTSGANEIAPSIYSTAYPSKSTPRFLRDANNNGMALRLKP